MFPIFVIKKRTADVLTLATTFNDLSVTRKGRNALIWRSGNQGVKSIFMNLLLTIGLSGRPMACFRPKSSFLDSSFWICSIRCSVLTLLSVSAQSNAWASADFNSWATRAESNVKFWAQYGSQISVRFGRPGWYVLFMITNVCARNPE